MKSCEEKRACEKCGRLITIINYNRHFIACKNKKEVDIDTWDVGNGKCKCPHCKKIFSRLGIKNHIWRSHTEHKVKPHSPGGWNKGLTKETSEGVAKQFKALKESYASGKIIGSFTGKTHNEETKKKISKKRIEYLNKNPDKVPYVLNHYSKGKSYPERYFEDLFKNENINVTPSYRIGLYELDFAIVDKKIDIEIDGSQHYNDKRIVESDIRRTRYLNDLGWSVIRINWAEYNSKSFQEKQKFIKELLQKIYS